MSTIKISQLPLVSVLNANTSNTLFVAVDIPTGVTGQFTAHTLAQGLYSNEILNVGVNQQNLPNTVAQFSSSGESYIQTNLVNTSDGGSADIVVTANVGSGGTDSTNFIDMGYANKNYTPGSEFNNIGTAIYPLDGYLYVQGTTGSLGGNLAIGTTTTGTTLRFMAGGGTSSNVVASMTSANISLLRDVYTSGNTRVAGNLFATTITTYVTNANLILDPNGNGDVILPVNTELFIQSGATANANTNGSVVITGGIGLTGNIYSGSHYITGVGNGITFVDGTFQTTAGSSVANTIYLQGGLNSANANISTLFANIAAIQGVDLTQNTNIQSAWTKANNAIANTNGVITAGDLFVSGNLGVIGFATTGLVTVNAISYIANTPAVRISGSANNYSQLPVNQGYMLQVTGFANVSSRIVNDAFGANSYPVYVGRQARGTALNPLSTANNDVLLRISGNGWANSFSQFGQSRIDFVAEENFTDLTKGTRIEFWNSAIGSNTLNKIATFNSNTVTFTGVVQPQKGFIWYPRQLPGAQTAITLDFASDSVIRAQTATGLTVSFANYTPGKVVDMWITNTAGTNQTFTHGCSALNSTVNATTYTIPGTSTIFVKYISFGTDIGNTFVSITHA